jgi:RNA polymerase sigma-70 factor (ECF subfamily)
VALDEERTVWLTTLYQANVRMVFTTCRRLLHNPEDAADATHEVFLRAAASLHTPPDGKDARAWLTTVARNHCLDILRRRRRYQSALTTLGAGTAPLESETVVVDRQLAQAVLEQLAVRERQALWASHVEQRPVGEIAERLGLSYLAAAQLLSRARRRAALVAAELAAILALIRSGVLRRRALVQNMGQPVAAVLVVPLVVTALISTSSGTQTGLAANRSVAKVHQQSVLLLPGNPIPNQTGPAPSGNVAPRPAANPVTGAVSQVVNRQTVSLQSPKVVPSVAPRAAPAATCQTPLKPPYKWGHLKQCLGNKSAKPPAGHSPAGRRRK